jgi:DNA-binding response OmpR family regulator
MNGFEVLKAIREASDVPCSCSPLATRTWNQVRGLELGADDYVGKPFSHLALMARSKAALRRAELPAPVQALPDFETGDLSICFTTSCANAGHLFAARSTAGPRVGP